MKQACAALVALLALAAPTRAEPARFALVIGSNAGDKSEVELRYAEDDARRIADILRRLGDFDPRRVVTLTRPTMRELSRSLDELGRAMEAETSETLLFVFYSGHADAETLHLAGARFPVADLRDFIERSPATARVLVVDACRSGAVTRVKGGRVGPSFDVRIEPPVGARGYAILTSSAAGEEAQESDELRGSFFTHYLASALLGAADKDQDGSVSVEEAFAYAADRTLVATASTVTGPQHPTYRFDLSGRDTLVLTRPARGRGGLGSLKFPRAGWFLVRRSGGPVLAELHADEPGRLLALEPGPYRVTMREKERYSEGDVLVRAGETMVLSLAGMRSYDYTPVARKGGAVEPELELRRIRRKPRWKPIYFGGLGLFTATYLAVSGYTIGGFREGDVTLAEAGTLFIPAVGPIVVGSMRLAGAPTLANQVGGALFLAGGALQAVGLTLTIVGDIYRRREQPPKRVAVTPIISAGGFGVGVSGAF